MPLKLAFLLLLLLIERHVQLCSRVVKRYNDSLHVPHMNGGTGVGEKTAPPKQTTRPLQISAMARNTLGLSSHTVWYNIPVTKIKGLHGLCLGEGFTHKVTHLI